MNREQLIALVESIDFSRADGLDEIEEMIARSERFAASVPHPDAHKLLDRVWADKDRSAAEVVDEALAWKVPERFCLPGTVDTDWADRG